MASMAEKLQFIITADPDQAIKAFQKTGDVAEKEMRRAKSELDATGARLTKFGAGALAAAGIAGAALFKAAGSFEDLAISSGKFADASGLAVDQASRWREVAGDLSIDSGVLESSLNKMNKTAGGSPKVFKDLGVEIAKTATGATDVNGTFLNVVDRLNGIKDPAERASVATQLLGKNWTGMADLIATGSGSLKTALAGVGDAQVISPEELAKAEEYRAAMDSLGDSLKGIALDLGQGVMPMVSSVAGVIEGAVSAFGSLNAVTGGAAGALLGIGTATLGVAGAMSLGIGQAIKMRSNFASLGPAASSAAVGVGVLSAALIAAQGIDAATGSGAFADFTDQINAYIASTGPDVQQSNDEIRSSFFQLSADVAGSTGIIESSWQGVKDLFSGDIFSGETGLNGAEEAFAKIMQVGPEAAQAAIDAFRELDPTLLSEAYGITTAQLDEWQVRVDNAAAAADVLAKSTTDASGAVAGLGDVFADYSGALKTEAALLDVVDQMVNMSIAAGDASTSLIDQRQDLNKTKQSVIDYAASIEGIKPEAVTNILALLDQGKYRAAADALAALSKPILTTLSISASIAWRNDKRAGLTADHAERNAVSDATKAGQDLANQIADAFKKGASSGGGGGGGGGGSTVRMPAEVMADWDAVIAHLVELGEMDATQYAEHLKTRLGQYEKYSDDYMRVYGELQQLMLDEAAKEQKKAEDAAKAKADEIAQEQAKVDAMYELGEISREDYRAQLADRLKSTEKYSSDYMRIVREIAGIDKEVAAEKKASEDAAAKAEQDRLAAEQKASEDAKRAAEEAQRAQDDALNRAAMQSIVAANIGGATYATINTAADPNAVINAIKQYERRNGDGWRN